MNENTESQLQKITADFESFFNSENNPWDYSTGASEKYRYQAVIAKAQELKPNPERVMEIGCCLGQFTALLEGWPKEVVAVDISKSAVQKAEANIKAWYPNPKTNFSYYASPANAVPIPNNSLELVFLLDVLMAVSDADEIRKLTLIALKEQLVSGGYLITTDYLNPNDTERYITMLKSSGLELVEVIPLYDRLWFRLRSNINFLRGTKLYNKILNSNSIANYLRKQSRKKGHKGSKHQIYVLRKA